MRAPLQCALYRRRLRQSGRALGRPLLPTIVAIARLAFIAVVLPGSFAPAQQVPEVSGELFAPLDIGESIPVSIVDLTGDSASAGIDDAQLARWALEDWSRALDGQLAFHVVDDEDLATIRIRFVPPGGGQYGEMLQLRIGEKRGAAVFVRPDTQALGSVIAGRAARDPLYREAIVYLTCVHELGHALGLAHTSDYADIMYAFGFGGDIEEYFLRYRRQIDVRDDIGARSGLSDSDRARVRALYSLEAEQ